MAIITQSGSPQFPAAVGSVPPSSREQLDAALGELAAKKDAWVRVSLDERIAIMDRLLRDYMRIAARWVAASCQAKGIAADGPAAGEEWVAGAWTLVRHLRLTRQSLADIKRYGAPRIPGTVRTLPNGQVAAGVLPTNRYDALLFSGVTADVWMQPGVTAAGLAQTQAVAYREKAHVGRVALVLGAGNVSSIAPLDALYKLMVEDAVVLLKMNPVNAYLGPLIEEAFGALVDPGYLRVVYGGAAEGAYLCAAAAVDDIHITGSDKSFDAIVFGTGPEGAARKAAGTPLLTKPITGELGNVSPMIVVPGPWSASDLDYQAAHIATSLTNNAGYNCNATRVIIQHAGWGQRQDLLQRVQGVLRKVPPRAAYYPGARDRYQAFVAAHPETVQVGEAPGDALPWALIPDVDAAHVDDIAFTTEAFCSLFAETELDAPNAAEYIARAVDFCNERLYGTLNVTLLVHPQSLKDAAVTAALERAVADLRYGTVAINYWASGGFCFGSTPWGAFPGTPLSDIQSGTGVVHNTLMFSRSQKTVIRAPFRAFPIPPWFVTRGRAGTEALRRMTYLEASPSPFKVPGVALAALG